VTANYRDHRPLPPVSLTFSDIFGGDLTESFIKIEHWQSPIQFFVGPNGSGKSKTAVAVKSLVNRNQASSVRYLQADRLLSFYHMGHYGGNLFGPSSQFRGFPLDPEGISAAQNLHQSFGMATDAFYILREQPHARLRTAALLKQVFGRELQMSEMSGLLDPRIGSENATYSLLRDEGQGLKELVVLLASIFDESWRLLVIDEPELHFHPAAASLIIEELRSECERSKRNAIVVTHDSRSIRPRSFAELGSIWVFRSGRTPRRADWAVIEQQQTAIAGDLAQNPSLLSELIFSPRAVLVEGERDVAALSSASSRLCSSAAEIPDFVRCGGVGAVARWFEISRKLGLSVRAISDLDGLFELSLSRAMDDHPVVKQAYAAQWQCDKTNEAMKIIYDSMRREGVGTSSSERRVWLAKVLETHDGHVAARANKILKIWRDAGVWLHSNGDLEATLGMPAKADALSYRNMTATSPTRLDEATVWSMRKLDIDAEILRLLQTDVERIANEIQRRLGVDKTFQTATPIGLASASDSSLVLIEPLGMGRHRIIVKTPPQFVGWWVEFERNTLFEDLCLRRPG